MIPKRGMRSALAATAAAAGAAATLWLAGCATVPEVSAPRRMEFALDRVADARIAGVTLKPGLHYSDLGITDMARLAGAVRAGAMPIEMTVHVRAENPADNPVAARLVDLDWTLFVEDREALAGSVEGGAAMPPGAAVDLPLAVRFDLLGFGHRGARDLFDLAIGITGLGGTPRDLRLELMPTIETRLGPVAYPRPIVVRKAANLP